MIRQPKSERKRISRYGQLSDRRIKCRMPPVLHRLALFLRWGNNGGFLFPFLFCYSSHLAALRFRLIFGNLRVALSAMQPFATASAELALSWVATAVAKRPFATVILSQAHGGA
jgi:hypothetical protein